MTTTDVESESPIDLSSDDSIDLAVRLTKNGRRLIRDLVRVRDQHDLHRSDVADAIGVHRSGITRFEQQQTSPQLDTILRYAHAVGAEVTFSVSPVDGWACADPAVVTRVKAWNDDATATGEDDRSVSVDTFWFDAMRSRVAL